MCLVDVFQQHFLPCINYIIFNSITTKIEHIKVHFKQNKIIIMLINWVKLRIL